MSAPTQWEPAWFRVEQREGSDWCRCCPPGGKEWIKVTDLPSGVTPADWLAASWPAGIYRLVYAPQGRSVEQTGPSFKVARVPSLDGTQPAAAAAAPAPGYQDLVGLYDRLRRDTRDDASLLSTTLVQSSHQVVMAIQAMSERESQRQREHYQALADGQRQLAEASLALHARDSARPAVAPELLEELRALRARIDELDASDEDLDEDGDEDEDELDEGVDAVRRFGSSLGKAIATKAEAFVRERMDEDDDGDDDGEDVIDAGNPGDPGDGEEAAE
ncbi:MAG: hypothetical protein Q8Q14_05255 [Gemmatimonadales bacterium]|nr:hypothetical protein [Gemmatimonadales bacterium]